MKTILVPIDFSDTSTNALNYAIELAKPLKAELLLYHCYYIPEFVHDPVLSVESADVSERESRESLNRLKTSILKNHTDLNINTFCSSGITVNEINELAKRKHANLIVVGARGAGYLEEKIIGGTASSLIHSAEVPVMVIDEHVNYKTPKNIVLASDFIETNNKVVLKPVKELAHLFKSHICILNVYQEPI